ncbi:MAG: FAD-dependent oxidoreductase [Rhodospirillales bacterium]|jgi:L-2-hydroxyglutarate oxidase LhgO|nr:FAD-dependent oxidoreductase [Rhodospirillales bacterium]
MDRTKCVVVGAGVIGLACARRMAMGGSEVVIVEAADAIGTGMSARSNEVVHAGLYYRPGSPQARLCVSGRDALFAYCEHHGVACEPIGKLVVATDEAALSWLTGVRANARANGAGELEWLDEDGVRALEPEIRCRAALHSPATGIVDSHGLMLALLGDAEAAGAVLALGSALRSVSVTPKGFALGIDSGGEATRLECRFLINAAGIGAAPIAQSIDGLRPESIPKIHLAKGTFFALSGPSPFRHLIVPDVAVQRAGGIFTLDLAGRGRFGPDEEWIAEVDYGLDAGRAPAFTAAVRRYYPGLDSGALQPDYVAVRPRRNGPGEAMADWLLAGPREHGVAGLVNMCGFESPGLTAALPIADAVAAMLLADADADVAVTGAAAPV